MNKTSNIILRSRIIRAVRYFFHKQDFIEVETPVRLPCPALEDYIDAIPASSTYGEKQYLRTSPELHLKRFLADANGTVNRVFQIGSCFRQGEIGSQHNEEFAMLEWYRLKADYKAILQDTIDLIRFIASETGIEPQFRGNLINLDEEWELLTVAQAFDKYAECSVKEAIANDEFEIVLTEQVEPNLGKKRPTFLIDYPASMAALARLSADNPEVCERWELYIGGLELANCYSELTDAEEQRQRFTKTAELRASEKREVYPIDEPFLESLQELPDCGGIAMGLDRLCMVFANADSIEEVTFR